MGPEKPGWRPSRKLEWWEAAPPLNLQPLHWNTWLLVGPAVWVLISLQDQPPEVPDKVGGLVRGYRREPGFLLVAITNALGG